MLNIRLLKLVKTCDVCPSQWDAWGDDGSQYYIRYRHSFFRVDNVTTGQYGIIQKEIDDGPDGFMSDAAMLEHAGFIVDENTEIV